MSIQSEVIEILDELCPDVDCGTCTTLIDDRHLSSLTMVALVAELEETFDIEIPPAYAVPANFNSAWAISLLVERLLEEDD